MTDEEYSELLSICAFVEYDKAFPTGISVIKCTSKDYRKNVLEILLSMGAKWHGHAKVWTAELIEEKYPFDKWGYITINGDGLCGLRVNNEIDQDFVDRNNKSLEEVICMVEKYRSKLRKGQKNAED